jgi:hypothetical protein
MSDIPVTGEVSNSKLAAVFDSEATARAAATAVADEAGLESAQVKVIAPGDGQPNIKLEPEGGGIWRTILVAHAWLGGAGVVVGLLVFAAMMWMDVPAISRSPWMSFPIFVVFGGIFGLLVGGLVSLRPDHDRYVLATQEAMAERRTTVVVHALSTEQARRAAKVLSGLGAQVTRTL